MKNIFTLTLLLIFFYNSTVFANAPNPIPKTKNRLPSYDKDLIIKFKKNLKKNTKNPKLTRDYAIEMGKVHFIKFSLFIKDALSQKENPIPIETLNTTIDYVKNKMSIAAVRNHVLNDHKGEGSYYAYYAISFILSFKDNKLLKKRFPQIQFNEKLLKTYKKNINNLYNKNMPNSIRLYTKELVKLFYVLRVWHFIDNSKFERDPFLGTVLYRMNLTLQKKTEGQIFEGLANPRNFFNEVLIILENEIDIISKKK